MDRERIRSLGPVASARRADGLDAELRERFAAFASGRRRGLALVAVGGYGRRRMAPGSDVDVLIVHDPARADEAARASAAVLYPLWDRRVATGHAVRTLEQCRMEARADLATLTGLLGARLVGGDPHLAAAVRDVAIEVVAADPGGFLRALRRSREQRRARFGELAHSQEPDLREALGGLRDLDLLAWLDAAVGPDGRPAPTFGQAWAEDGAALLTAARAALHRAAGGRSNRLEADEQSAVAAALGFADEPGWEARDALMREVHAAGRRIDVLAERRLIEALEGAGEPAAPRVPLPAGVPIATGALLALAEAAEAGGLLDDAAAAGVEQGIRAGGAPVAWQPAGVAALVRLLAAGDRGMRALEVADALGLLGALLPEWADLRGRPQRDPYHRFPVDVHLLRAACEMARRVRAPGDPLVAEAAAVAGDAGPLLLGALLHDCGKVGRGSHLRTGPEVAQRMLDRMGVGGAAAGDVRFLVAEHLLLGETAVRRDVADEDLLVRVAARVGDRRRLAMLFLLTLADAAATGPHASTPWRGWLVRDLVARLDGVLEHGVDPERGRRVERAEARIREALADAPPRAVEAFLRTVPDAYRLAAPPGEAPRHLPLVVPPPGPGEIRTAHAPGSAADTHALAVAARDRPGLLAAMAGALTVAGLSILSARVFTTANGVALDLFDVRSEHRGEVEAARWDRFREALEGALDGSLDLAGAVRSRRGHQRRPRFAVPVTVRVDPGAPGGLSLVEVGAPDRTGLLFDLAHAFAEHGVDVHLAQVATYGPRVVDAFHVSNPVGAGRLAGGEALAELVEALRAAAG